MKFTKIIINCGFVLSTALFAVSCQKDTIQKEVATESNDFADKALVQVIDVTLSSTRNYVYVDGAPVNGAAIAYGGIFPSSPSSSFAVAGGLRSFIIRDTAAATTQPSMTFSENLQPNNYYTIFTYDTVNAVKNKLVPSDIFFPSDTTARLRFANFAYSPNAIPAVDIFSKRLNANIFTNIPVTSVTGFIPFDSRRADTLIVRETGTGIDLPNRTVAGTPPVTTVGPVQIIVGLTRKRNYTLIFRGGYRTDLNSATTVRSLLLVANN